MARRSDFFSNSLKNFYTAVANLFIFLPYFFSVTTLFKTLFAPWKNLTSTKTTRGFSIDEWFSRLSFNIISRIIGCMMRASIILFYAMCMTMFVIFLPIIFVMYVLMLPIRFFFDSFKKSDEELKAIEKQQFMSTHLLNQENYQVVESWFEHRYLQKKFKAEWWQLKNLFSTPPLARDWAVGYTPLLDDYVSDLTNATYQFDKTHFVGRLKEIQVIEQTLSRSEEANVILVGEEGVGKHAIIDAFTRKIYEGKTNNLLAYKRVLKLNMEKILTKFLDQKQREEFMEELLREAYLSKNIILVIDNFDKYIAYGDERVDLSLAIEKYAKTAGLQIIGITSPFAYEKFVYPNEKIGRFFTKLAVTEVTQNEALQILIETSEVYEQRYKVHIPYETLQAAVEKSDFFITDVPFPEKAFQLLDSSCVYTVQTLHQTLVVPSVIDIILTEKTHVPTTLNEKIKTNLVHLESLLSTRVINQEQAISELSSALRRSFLLYGKRRKPLATFLFLGPTGVGKTETAKAIADVFFGTEKELIRFDMSLYQTKNDISKLVGSAETQTLGLLTNAIRENPYGVLLLDEIEKANHDLLNIFLTLFDEGYFTDGSGDRVDCKNLVIIATSNAGADYIYSVLKANQNTQQKLSTNEIINYLVTEKIFSPEFLNRFDGVIAFNPLMQESAVIIARKMLHTITEEIFTLYKVKVNVSEETLNTITRQGYDPAFGARNMERVIRQQIEDEVAKQILEGKAREGDVISF